MIRRPGEASSQCPALRHEVTRARQTTTPAENSLVHLIRCVNHLADRRWEGEHLGLALSENRVLNFHLSKRLLYILSECDRPRMIRRNLARYSAVGDLTT